MIGAFLSAAFNALSSDRDWLPKLVVTAVVTMAGLMLAPLVVGLAAWSMLLGYQARVIRHVRAGRAHPLPPWDDFGRYLSDGAGALAAFIAYNLPNFAIACGTFFVVFFAGNSLAGSSALLITSCCMLPLLLVYNLFAQALFALGMGRYSSDPRAGVFFEFSALWALLRANSGAVLSWLAASVIAVLGIGALAVIPCIGWAVGLAVYVPVASVLNGQLAAVALGRPRGV